jgi:hypothetical protein
MNILSRTIHRPLDLLSLVDLVPISNLDVQPHPSPSIHPPIHPSIHPSIHPLLSSPLLSSPLLSSSLSSFSGSSFFLSSSLDRFLLPTVSFFL